MSGKMFGYARVSTKQQNEDRQIEALTKFGVCKGDIYIDKESGKSLERENYLKLRNEILREGDTLVVKELDRLSRNKSDIKKELEDFRNMGVRVIILNIPTTQIRCDSENIWIIEMVNSILIEVLGSLAEEERNRIHRRQNEGIQTAHKRGVKFGRPSVKKPANWDSVMNSLEKGDITAVEAMKRLRLKKTTFYKLLRDNK